MVQIPKESYVSHVALKVADLELMRDYYHNIIGLVIRQESETEVRLGTATHDLVILKSHPEGTSVARQSGLYHLALLMPDRVALASWLRRFMSKGHKLDGTGDHRVSEALYFSDPEGNGIEVYADRPQEQWEWDGEQVKLMTAAINLPNLLRDAAKTPMTQVPDGLTMGHAHLKVADIEETRNFYVDTLGFNLMSEMTNMGGVGALFVAAGNYHHHLGLNNWHSKNVPADSNALGLDAVQLNVPDVQTIEQLVEQVEQAEYPFEYSENRLELTDPSQNKLVFTTSSSL